MYLLPLTLVKSKLNERDENYKFWWNDIVNISDDDNKNNNISDDIVGMVQVAAGTSITHHKSFLFDLVLCCFTYIIYTHTHTHRTLVCEANDKRLWMKSG